MRAPLGNVVQHGTAGSDSLDFSSLANGYHGLDWVTAGGSDKVYGTIYDDTFTLGRDAEYIDGNAGWDTVLYTNSTSGVSVDLTATVQHGGFAEGDQLRHIENVTGSQFGDTLIGDAGVNVLDGQGGNDKMAGGEGDDTLSGGDGNDALFGDNGRDVLHGGNGDDNLSGGNGDDQLFGDLGNDTLRGGLGTDHYDGGAGTDTVDYTTAPAVTPFLGAFDGVWLDLSAGQGYSGDAAGDTYVDVENVRGTAYNDLLQGDEHDNVLSGNGGNDWIIGGAGADTLDGGSGRNQLSYYQSSSGVVVDLASNQVSGGDANGDSIANFQDVDGSDFNDQLFATHEGSSLIGRSGDDLLVGREGNDRLHGSAGNDTLVGGGGADTFVFDAIENNFSLHQGVDVILDYRVGTDHLNFSGGLIQSLADLHFVQAGGNTIITYDDGGSTASIMLVGVDELNLLGHAQTDFMFTMDDAVVL